MIKFFQKTHQQQGFTLIELLVAATIIIVLTAIGLVSYRQANISGRNAKRRADIETLRQALVLFRSEKGYYPGDQSMSNLLSDSEFKEYIEEDRIKDPRSTIPYFYEYSSAESCGAGACSFTLTYYLEPNGTQQTATSP